MLGDGCQTDLPGTSQALLGIDTLSLLLKFWPWSQTAGVWVLPVPCTVGASSSTCKRETKVPFLHGMVVGPMRWYTLAPVSSDSRHYYVVPFGGETL